MFSATTFSVYNYFPFSCTDISVNTVHDRVQQITFKSLSFDMSCILSFLNYIIKVNAIYLSIGKIERFPEVSSLIHSQCLITNKNKTHTLFPPLRMLRRMFPAMRVKISGLDPHQQYYIAMDIVPVDNKRYRYSDQMDTRG